MALFVHDLRLSLRSLRRRPGFTSLAVSTIAIGIGANVAIFSVVHAVLLRPLPYHDPDRLVHILNRSKTASRLLVSHRDVADYWERATLFEAIGARGFTTGEVRLEIGEEVVVARIQQVTDNLFPLLGVEPALGRGFVPEDRIQIRPPQEGDTVPPVPARMILSHEFWRRSFGGDPNVVGKAVRFSGFPAVVIGVMPAEFSLLTSSEAAAEPPADMWFPIAADFETYQREWGRGLVVFGRLAPGVSVARAQAQMDAIAAWQQEQAEDYRSEDIRIQVLPLHHDVVKEAGPPLLMLTGAVAFLLLLACANVASLMLVRARGKATELSIRAALGCGRKRLAAQVLLESGLLALAGGAFGVALAAVGVRALVTLAPPSVPRLDTVAIGWPVLVFSVGASVLTAALFGLAPAIQSAAIDIAGSLKEGAQRSIGGGRNAVLGWLVALEVAVSVMLVAGAALMVRTFANLHEIRPGFDPQGLLSFVVSAPNDRFQNGQERASFFREVSAAVAALPGVRAVGATSHLPLDGGRFNGPYAWDSESEAAWMSNRAAFRFVSGDFFEAMGTRLLAGRTFNTQELTEPTDAVIVDELVAKRAWPGENPLGRSLVARRDKARGQVVGVVEHIRHRRLTADHYPTIYFPAYFGAPNQVVRSDGDLGTLAGALRHAVEQMGPGITAYKVRPMMELVADQLAPTRFALLLMTIFSVIALVLAAVGLYGVISYAVRERTAEIGIRMTLGADRRSILRMVLKQGSVLLVAGGSVGLVGAWVLSRFIQGLLFGVDASDPLTLLAVTAIVGVVGVGALYWPAARGAATSPVLALRGR